MCGRYSNEGTNVEQLVERFDAQPTLESFAPSANIKPTHTAPVVIEHKGQRELHAMQWGLIPAWAKDPKIGYKTFNARAETIAEKPAFRHAFKHKRCLVPARAFYEWLTENGRKVPYSFSLEENELFAFAGLYDVWKTPSGEPLYTYTIITTTPNELVEKVHNRMPVMLSPDAEAVWLDPNAADPDRLQALLVPYDASLMAVQRYEGTL
ncbi:MAG TPA: SOS response-associated peptidase [Herpetosiphonaceae bacterium]